jgi:2-oxoglutarate dehydrogenase complex dehydrogenase (E1) component-like enzyme
MTPKWLLRLPDARSKAEELTQGHFMETLDDPFVEDKAAVKRVLLCSGKIAYQLGGIRNEKEHPAAIVRVEQFYPYPGDQIVEILQRYPNASEVYWVQEEPVNMGAWAFIQPRLLGALPDRMRLNHVARFESASPATGSTKVHEQEQQELLDSAFAGL